MQIATLFLFSMFVIFQLIYIIVPLIKLRGKQYCRDNDMINSFTILIPAYNEAEVMEGCILGIRNLSYENFEAIIINDGSTDGTLDKLNSLLLLERAELLPLHELEFKPIKDIYRSTLFPKIFVIDKENGGKADSLNTGLEYSKNEIIITLDADCVLRFDALEKMNSAFQKEELLAAGGMIHIVQGISLKQNLPVLNFKKSNLIKYQIIQYLTNFYLYKSTHSTLKSMTVIAGAFGAFRREVLLRLKGYRQTIGEDMEITLRIQHYISTEAPKKRVSFVPEAVCYTECPESFRNLFKQRLRWQRGFLDCIKLYSNNLFKSLGLSVSLYLFFDSFLLGTIIAFPTIAIPLILILLNSSLKMFIAFLSISFSLGVLQSISALYISKKYGYEYALSDIFRLLLFIPFEIISYRLLGLLFVTFGTLKYFKKDKEWYKVERVGRGYEIICEGEYAVAEEASR